MTDTVYTVVLQRPTYQAVREDAFKKVVAEARQGPQGPAGTSTTTVINITEPSLSWTLAHYLGRYPSVTLIDTSGDNMLATINYVDSNVITVTFTAPTNGVAYLN